MAKYNVILNTMRTIETYAVQIMNSQTFPEFFAEKFPQNIESALCNGKIPSSVISVIMYHE